jgi:4-hydroxy-tetrahydrodipicolinate reductase
VRLILVGYGRMGRLVESLAPEFGAEVAGVIDRSRAASPGDWPAGDVAIDFSSADAVPVNAPRLASKGVDLLIGTTGWQAQEARVRAAIGDGVGIVAASNFAIGVNIFLGLVERAAELMQPQPSFGAWVHELHHAAKKDAPSGTALAIDAVLRRAGYARSLDVASTRAGAIPGTHTLGFDAPAETITLTHAARDRTAFARGALHAATWVRGRRGWFTMRDVSGG